MDKKTMHFPIYYVFELYNRRAGHVEVITKSQTIRCITRKITTASYKAGIGAESLTLIPMRAKWRFLSRIVKLLIHSGSLSFLRFTGSGRKCWLH